MGCVFEYFFCTNILLLPSYICQMLCTYTTTTTPTFCAVVITHETILYVHSQIEYLPYSFWFCGLCFACRVQMGPNQSREPRLFALVRILCNFYIKQVLLPKFLDANICNLCENTLLSNKNKIKCHSLKSRCQHLEKQILSPLSQILKTLQMLSPLSQILSHGIFN